MNRYQRDWRQFYRAAQTGFTGTIAVGEMAAGSGTRVVGRDIDLSIFHSQNGRGWAFDIGIAVHVNSLLAVSASVENIGQITWRDVTRQRRYAEDEVDLARLGWSPATQEFEFDLADGEFNEAKEPANDITWKLPMRVRVGVSYRFDQKVTLHGSVRYTRSGSGSGDTLVGGQIEYRPVSFAPLTVGASYSTQDKRGLEAGAGLMFNHVRIRVTGKTCSR